ncbi:MAG: hypothetical protein IT429_12615 [Gemmataceae bacterium]|nr:hypothetical protein [Gemmataceae bacterium]
MKLDKEFALKHKFWLAFAGSLFFVLVAIFLQFFIVPGTTAEARKKVETEWDTFKKYTDPKNQKFVDVALVKAKKEKAREDEVWRDAYQAQKKLITFPAGLEQEFEFTKGYFALEVTPLGKDATLPPDEPKPAEEANGPTGKFHGVITRTAPESIEVRGRDPKDPKKPAVRVFRHTPYVKVTLPEDRTPKDRSPVFADLDVLKGAAVAVTYQKGMYFNDRLTQAQQTTFANTYETQLKDILKEAQPLNEMGGVLVQFKGWLYDKNKLPLPAQVTGTAGMPGEAGSPGPGAPVPMPMPGPMGEAGGVFGTGANKFFRYVKEWKREGLDISDGVWIAQEDLWIQRELFRLVKKANDYVANFEPVKDAKGKAIPGVFRNPYWQMELSLKDTKVHAKITNLLDRVQRLDPRFMVQVQKDAPLVLLDRFDGEPLQPKGSKKDTFEQTFDLKGGYRPEGLFAVRQVLTWETAAIKRIDQIAIGTAAGDGWAQSHRTSVKLLKPLKELPAAAPDASTTGEMPMGEAPGPGPMGGGLPGGPGGVGGPQRGAILTPNGLVRNRYADVTPQARRVPVGLALIVDQMHVARVQTAFADSPLRFLTTQVLMHRYPTTVRPDSNTTGQFAGGEGYPGPMGSPGPMGFPGPMGSPSGGYPAPPPPGPGGYPMGPGPMGEGTMPGDPYAPGAQATGSDEQESNVALVIYGVGSLYERYPARKNVPAPPTEAPPAATP